VSKSRTFPTGEVAIVGVCESPRRKAPGVHPFEINAEVTRGALADAGLELGDVDGFCTASGFSSEAATPMNIVELSDYLGLRPVWFDSTDTGGCAFVTHAGHAAMAIASGVIDVALVSHAAAARSSPLPAPDFNTNEAGPGQWELPYGLSTVAGYALTAQRHMHEYGTTPEQLAEIAVQMRANATLNEHALYREAITVGDVVNSPMIASPLHRLDCCVITDSGAAFVLASKPKAEKLSRKPVWLLGFGEAISHSQMSQQRSFTQTSAVESGRRAFESSGLTPDEIDCAQIYDSFTITVLATIESLGFCGPGEGGAFVQDGNIAPDGSLPINTDGGGLSSNHPGRRGALATVEAVRQLRGESTGRQLDSPRTCLVNGTGGTLSATATMILGA
jgi:acetyl-CoA C-acetyltransferase